MNEEKAIEEPQYTEQQKNSRKTKNSMSMILNFELKACFNCTATVILLTLFTHTLTRNCVCVCVCVALLLSYSFFYYVLALCLHNMQYGLRLPRLSNHIIMISFLHLRCCYSYCCSLLSFYFSRLSFHLSFTVLVFSSVSYSSSSQHFIVLLFIFAFFFFFL